jgi:hypothetical protein
MMRPNWRTIRAVSWLLLKTAATLAVMVACGIVAFATAVVFLMRLGLKQHDNYEYYGSWPALTLVYGAGLAGFLIPGFLVWRKQSPWQFSLRSLLVAMTVIAVGLTIVVLILRM